SHGSQVDNQTWFDATLKAKNSNNDDTWLLYKNKSNLLKKECYKVHWEYLNRLANNLFNDRNEQKLFWNYLRLKNNGTNDLIILQLHNGDILTNESNITESMDEYFALVFTKEYSSNFPLFNQNYQRH
ncbi:unnamed protein product, partial [Pocillopora meandrina]